MFKLLFTKARLNDRGSALVFTLLVTAVLLVLSVAIMSLTTTDSQVASAQEEKKIAQSLAESAVELIKEEEIIKPLKNPGGTVTTGSFGPVQLDPPGMQGEYSYEIQSAGTDRYLIEITATVKRNGVIVAVKRLQVVIEYASTPPPNSTVDANVYLNENSREIMVGDSFALIATVGPTEATNKSVTWVNSDPDVIDMASIDQYTVTITGKKAGLATVTVKTNDGNDSDSCVIKVVDVPTPPASPASNPLAFNFSLLAQGGANGVFQLTNGNGGKIDIKGPAHSNSKVIIHTEKDSEINYEKISAAGDIKITGPGNEPTHDLFENQPLIKMPVVDWDYLQQNATVIHNPENTGNTTTYIDVSSGISENSIIFVNGNLDITGKLTENVIIAATGNINIFGDCDLPSTTTKTVGIFSGKTIKFYSEKNDETGIQGPEIRGLVMADQVITSGEAKVVGSLIVKNNMECGSGDLYLEYVEGEGDEKLGNPVYDLFRVFGTEIIKNFNELG